MESVANTTPINPVLKVEDQIALDLRKSGLTPEDIRARPIDMAERAAIGAHTSTEGYVIPYYSITGKALPFYRVKLFNRDIKYLQLKDTSNHVYFPPKFLQSLKDKNYVILTEGEKKAAAAVKAGFPCIAFGGVDSWRNRVVLLPKGTTFSAYSYNKDLIGAKLPSGAESTTGTSLEPIAIGFDDLCILLSQNNLHAIIIYDSDEGTEHNILKPEVQRSAAELGFELRRRGVPIRCIRQGILPHTGNDSKTGLDDFLLQKQGTKLLQQLINDTLAKRSAFPKHPSIEDDVNKKLQNSKLSRKDMQRLSLQLLTDLDSKGIRMYSKDEQQLYYFIEAQNRLLKVDLSPSQEQMRTTEFSKLLYRLYGISTGSDQRVMKWLATQFGGEEPIEAVTPYRVLARSQNNEDVIRFQLGDGQYVKITPDPKQPITILSNGSENVLFESGHSDPVDTDELLKEFAKRQEEYKQSGHIEMWWEDVLHEVRLKNHGKIASIFSLLYYLSPWLHRWRGTQLPAELVIGEAGCGKSTLCELRLSILSGRPNLRNAPADLKDWHASIVNTGGLHVTDNVQLLDKSLKQRLSDEICRLITEPDPHVEMRKYYTESDLKRVKVDPVFVFTSILQPFNNADLLQRSIIMELDKLAHDSSAADEDEDQTAISYDSSWKNTQLTRFGGRTAWLSHHLFVLHKFLERVQTKWDHSYKAKHRLINLEQSFIILADLCGVESAWIPDFLANQVSSAVVDADWTLEGLKEFCTQVNHHKANNTLPQFRDSIGESKTAPNTQTIFSSATIATWAAQQSAYMECQMLSNSRRLGRYLQTHKAMIAQTAGLVEHGNRNNKTTYIVKSIPN